MAETGTQPWTFHTPIYEDVDDGDRRPETGSENLRIFGFVGPRSIDSPVLITAACFEHDLGDITSTTNEIRTLLLVVGATAASTASPAGWVVAAVAAIGVGITYLVDLIGGDDQIGNIATLTLTEAQAHAFTQASNPHNFSPLRFDGGDADGIYDIFLALQRT
jgi:hypothetical protein